MSLTKMNLRLMAIIVCVWSVFSSAWAFNPKAGNYWEWKVGSYRFTTKLYNNEKVAGYKALQLRRIPDQYSGGSYYSNISGVGWSFIGTDVHDALSGEYLGIDILYPPQPHISGIQYGDPVGTTKEWIGYSLSEEDSYGYVEEMEKIVCEVIAYETVTVPFGTFTNAMKVKETNYDTWEIHFVDGKPVPGGSWDLFSEDYDWYVPVVGLIKNVEIYEDGYLDPYPLELAGCKVNGKVDFNPDGPGSGDSETVVDFIGTIEANKLPSSLIAGREHVIKSTIIIENKGPDTVDESPTIDIQMMARPVDGGDDIELSSVNVSIGNLKPGKQKKCKVNLVLPEDFSTGQCCFYAIVDSSDQIAEADETNNITNEICTELQPPFIDLQADIVNPKLPASLIAGDKTKIKLPVCVTNYGNVPVPRDHAPLLTEFFARPVQAADDSQDIKIAETLAKLSNLKPEKAKKLNVQFTIPAVVPEDTYYLVAQVESPEGFVESYLDNNWHITDDTISVVEGRVDLDISWATSKIPASITAGSSVKARLCLIVTNNGNIPTAKDHNRNVSFMARPQPSGQDIALAADQLLKADNLKPGKTKKGNFNITIPDVLPAGNYTVLAVIDEIDEIPGPEFSVVQ